jgi:hypothetical protein
LYLQETETPMDVALRLGWDAKCQWSKASVLENLNGRIVEIVILDKEKRKYYIKSARDDKLLPNSVLTATKTIQNVDENLRLIDLFPPGILPEEDRKWIQTWVRETPHT